MGEINYITKTNADKIKELANENGIVVANEKTY